MTKLAGARPHSGRVQQRDEPSPAWEGLLVVMHGRGTFVAGDLRRSSRCRLPRLHR